MGASNRALELVLLPERVTMDDALGGGRGKLESSIRTRPPEATVSTDGFAARLRSEAARRQREPHPFHRRMDEGRLGPEEMRLWIANRYYYQTRLPHRDAIIASRTDDPTFRGEWLRRASAGDASLGLRRGLSLWERLAVEAGMDRHDLLSFRRLLPGVRKACDEYITLLAKAKLVEAVAATLSDVLAPEVMENRIAVFQRHYSWLPLYALDCFRERVTVARRDGEFVLAFVLEHATTPAEQEGCLRTLRTKNEILAKLLDCVDEEAEAVRRALVTRRLR